VKSKILELFELAMQSEIFSRDQTFCAAVKSQVAQAIRMNRARLKDLVDAWRFMFLHICHDYGGDEQIQRFDRWKENEASKFAGSRWLTRGIDHWHIRLKSGEQIRLYLSEDSESHSLSMRTLLIDLWRLIRECELADPEIHEKPAPYHRHYVKAYEELQLQVEFLSICLNEELPEEVQRWLRFVRWKHGPPFKQRQLECPFGVEDCCEPVGLTRQPLDFNQVGVRSVRIDSSRQIIKEQDIQITSAGYVKSRRKMKINLSEDLSPYTELFKRDDRDLKQVDRSLPPEMGGIRLLRKRWILIHANSAMFGNASLAATASAMSANAKFQFLKKRTWSVPHEDPSGDSLAFPPVRSDDFIDWFTYEEGPLPVHWVNSDDRAAIRSSIPSPVRESPFASCSFFSPYRRIPNAPGDRLPADDRLLADRRGPDEVVPAAVPEEIPSSRVPVFPCRIPQGDIRRVPAIRSVPEEVAPDAVSDPAEFPSVPDSVSRIPQESHRDQE
jgi:hypothetical protein